MSKFFPQIRTKNSSAGPLRNREGGLFRFSVRSIVRLGSVTDTEVAFKKSFGKRRIVEINTVNAIQNSRSKLRMKTCFREAEVPQAEWWETIENTENLPYPILAKRVFGFKGRGMEKLDNREELERWLTKHPSLEGWYFERFYNYAREYRLHCTEDGCFMAWRKLRRNDAEVRWFFNSENCNWVSENHELFDKPENWNSIVESCKKALAATGLDIGSFDVRVQSRKPYDYILVEVNSAPALGEKGVNIYREVLNGLITKKINSLSI